jgi:hypothetical protein
VCERTLQLYCPKLKNLFDVWSRELSMQQSGELHGVAHHVAGECATVARLESVLVICWR